MVEPDEKEFLQNHDNNFKLIFQDFKQIVANFRRAL